MKQEEFNELQAKAKELQEQLDNAEIEKGNPFDVEYEDCAYFDLGSGAMESTLWNMKDISKFVPCKDKSIVEARQKRHHLSDLLEKFAWDNDAVVTDEILKDVHIEKYCIKYQAKDNTYITSYAPSLHVLSGTYFTTERTAKKAITEIVEPFMAGTL